jgi:hypothetical protein
MRMIVRDEPWDTESGLLVRLHTYVCNKSACVNFVSNNGGSDGEEGNGPLLSIRSEV